MVHYSIFKYEFEVWEWGIAFFFFFTLNSTIITLYVCQTEDRWKILVPYFLLILFTKMFFVKSTGGTLYWTPLQPQSCICKMENCIIIARASLPTYVGTPPPA